MQAQHRKYFSDITSVSDYYPFGSKMYGRRWDPVKPLYRFGFNTQEKVNEISPDHYTAKYWEYDSRIGRRWNRDPKPTVGESEYAVNQNNPINKNDPEGDCPWCVGALVSAGLDAGIQLLEIAFDDEKSLSDFDTKSVFISATTGAVGVGIISKITKLKTLAKISVEVMTDASTSAIKQKLTTGKVDMIDVGIDVIAGQSAGKTAEHHIEKIVKKQKEYKTLVKQAKKAQKLADRPSRIKKAKELSNKTKNYIVKRTVAGSIAGTEITSDALKGIKNELKPDTDKDEKKQNKSENEKK